MNTNTEVRHELQIISNAVGRIMIQLVCTICPHKVFDPLSDQQGQDDASIGHREKRSC